MRKISNHQDRPPEAQALLLYIKWMNWSEIAWYNTEIIEKEWQVYQNGLVLTQEYYPRSKNVKLPQRQLSTKTLIGLKCLLCFFFRLVKDDFSCFDGEGWEIIYYGADEVPLHSFNGYAYDNLILGHIIKLICGKEQSGY